MSLKSSAVQAVIWTLVRFWGGQGISLIVFAVLARFVEPSEFGLIALANIFVAFIGLNLTVGFSEVIIQSKELKSEELNTLFYSNIIIGLIMIAAICFLSPQVAQFYKNDDLTWVIRAISPNLLVASLTSIPDAILRHQLRFKVISLRTLVAGLTSGVVGIFLAVSGYGIWSLIAQLTVSNVVQLLIIWNAVSWKPGFKVSSFSYFEESLRTEFSMIGARSLDFIVQRTPALLIGYMLGVVALGYYTVAFKLIQALIMLLVVVVSQVAFPMLSKISDDLDKLRNTYLVVLKSMSMITFSCFLVVSAISSEIILVTFGDQWRESIRIMNILSFIGASQSIIFLNRSVVLSLGKIKLRFFLSFINTFFSLISIFVAAQHGKLIYVILSMVLSSYVFLLIDMVVVHRILRTRAKSLIYAIIPPILVSTALLGSAWVFNYWLQALDFTPTYRLVALFFGISPLWLSLVFIFDRNTFMEALEYFNKEYLAKFFARKT